MPSEPWPGIVDAKNALARRFRIFAFDWDGTAVENRHAEAGRLAARLDWLLTTGAAVVVVSGTNADNIERQLGPRLLARGEGRLVLATNRGSEAWAYDSEGRRVALVARRSTPEEDRLLDAVASEVRRELGARGLPVRVISNRLNRRKIDLIPEPAWANPPKARIGALLVAVEERLAAAGLAGGLAEACALTRRVAARLGFADARVTSDVKHVEVGLTDKGDSIRWVLDELAPTLPASPRELLIAGDEFGPIGGEPGSDDRMRIAAAEGAVFVSVGPEPGGVPAGVIHLGGGPDNFIRLLDQHAERAAGTALPARPTDDGGWLVFEDGYSAAREHEFESLFAVANGYVGTRGALAEQVAMSSPATFIAGVYGLTPRSGDIPELVAAPDWMRLSARVGGQALGVGAGRLLEQRRVLDMRQGILWRVLTVSDAAGHTSRVQGYRLASLAEPHLLAQSVTLVPEHFSARVALETRIDNPADARPLEVRHDEAGRVTAMSLRPSGSGTTVAFAARGEVRGADEIGDGAVDAGAHGVVERWSFDARAGERYRFDRLVAVTTSRDPDALAPPIDRALGCLAGRRMWSVTRDHVGAWLSRWRQCAVDIDGDADAERALRFATYHLISAARAGDERVSIGARALTGPAYQGHVFWDTEIYMLPFFVLTAPDAARSLLGYRFHTLDAAREKARTHGLRGALYAWESAADGREATPPILVAPNGEVLPVVSGEQEHHISADVAWAVASYLDATDDTRFFVEQGAEILVETARMWASRGEQGADGAYHLRRVLGPDEYHEGVDDDAFTNGMARWNLGRGADAAERLAACDPDRWRALAERLALSLDEAAGWRALARTIPILGLDGGGVIEQFAGYFALAPIDLSTARLPMIAELLMPRERIAGSQIVKQPDVVMLLALLWDQLSPSLRKACFRYYEPRTCHGSSLSPPIFALVAARLGHVALALRYFRMAAEIDLANNMGNAAGGVHAAALGGLWQAAVLGFGGLRAHGDGLRFDPHLPPEWRSLGFALRWRGQLLRVAISDEGRCFELSHEGEAPAPVRLGDRAGSLRPGRWRSRRGRAGWTAWEAA